MKFAFYAKLILTGAIILGLELVASRILIPFFGVSLNVWSSILAVTLIALAIGYKFGGYLSNHLKFSSLVAYFVSSGAISAAWLNFSFFSYPILLSRLSDWNLVSGSIIACFYIIFVPLFVFASLNSALIAILSDAKYNNTGNKDHNSGSVFFTSTIGSVIGIFFVTYFLLANFSNHSVYIFLSLTSALATFLLALICVDVTKKHKVFLCAAGLIMALVSTSFVIDDRWGFTSSTFQKPNVETKWTIIAKEPSFYGNHTIVDYNNEKGTKWRGLLTGGLINAKMYKSGISAATFTHALELLAVSGKELPKNALVLGLGVGVIPTNLSKNGSRVDVVELDPKVSKIAQKYFDFDKSLVNLYLEDARTFVRTCPDKYDVILIDLFRGDGIPPHVVSFDFFADIKECLSDHGALVMNSFYGAINSASKKSLFKTLVSVYDKIVVFEAPAKKEQKVQQGYILTRKTKGSWSFNISVGGRSKVMLETLLPIFNNWKEYNQDSEFIKDVMPIYDERNDWRRQTIDLDIAYRKKLTSILPWQVLLD